MTVAAALIAAAAAGLVSAPHCAAMCGPLALAACEAPSREESLRAGTRYGLGRLTSYMVGGALAGALGAGLVRLLRGETLQRGVSLAMALGLALAAWRVLRGRNSPLVQLRRGRARRRVPAALMGLATGLLPCGALASGLLIAAGSGSWWAGSAAMAVFAIASAPGLLAVVLPATGLRAALTRAATPARRKLGAAVLLVAACWVAARPWVMPERQCHCRGAATSTIHG
ncbi:MAG: sulfite exporter TauE/SafE family protein [Deltaproteobacteria bacterium]|nr:sulfite exporter TauE/SafE family protein [Myxococcales bacterium]MDP3220759.1 sulfite exporter TauE/SafE family protein [Deltaproteobacteria bacterium]